MRYPILTELITQVMDGEVSGDPDNWLWPDYARDLEHDAKRLPKEDTETFCCGDDLDIQALAERYDLKRLDDFLNNVFEGDYELFPDFPYA
jgi:hypothetical protein